MARHTVAGLDIAHALTDDSSATNEPARAVASRTLSRGLAVLRGVADMEGAATVAAIAVSTTLDRAVVHRLLHQLCSDGFVVRDHAGRTYSLGPAVQALTSTLRTAHPRTIRRRS